MKSRFWIAFLLLAILVSIPFFLVKFLPCTDLPQHLCQTRLFYETFYHGSDVYKINSFGANTFCYLLMFVLWHFLPPVLVGKMIFFITVIAQIAAIFYYAYKRERSLFAAVFSSVFVFNLSFYWGFLPFLLGMPFFMLWVLTATCYQPGKSWQVKMLGLALILYLSHVLWLAAACFWLLCFFMVERFFRPELEKKAMLLPFLVVSASVAYWFFGFLAQKTIDGSRIEVLYYLPFWMRLNIGYLAQVSNLPIHGYANLLILAVASVLILWALITAGKKNGLFDLPLLIAAVAGFTFSFFAPDSFLNTIEFASRWLPYSFIFLLLAIPASISNHKTLELLLGLFVALTLIWQGYIWHRFEKEELKGLSQAIMQIEPGKKVLWIDFLKGSKYLNFRPFAQVGSYLEVLANCKTNFSFARHSTGIISFRKQEDNLRQKLYSSDDSLATIPCKDFDYILINGHLKTHLEFAEKTGFACLSNEEIWRVYQVP